jgi:aminobenzoyl-glutamate transport protein
MQKLLDWLERAGNKVPHPAVLFFLLIALVVVLSAADILPKWAITAPIFVPLFIKLGIGPEVVLAAHLVSDSPPNVINPRLPPFGLVVGFARHYDKKTGVDTLVALMLRYTLITMIVWVLIFLAWYLLGLPWGPV